MNNFKTVFTPDRQLKLYRLGDKFDSEVYISPPKSILLRECEWWKNPATWLVYPQEIIVKDFNDQVYNDLCEWYEHNVLVGQFVQETDKPFIYKCSVNMIRNSNIACMYDSNIYDIIDTSIICVFKSFIQILEGNSKVNTIIGKSPFLSTVNISNIKDTVRICNVMDCNIGVITDFAQIRLVKNTTIMEMKYNSQIWISDNSVIYKIKHNASVETLLNFSKIWFLE